MNKYISTFFKTGIFFGLFMGIFYAFQNQSILAGTIGGIFAGILFGVSITFITYVSDKKLKIKGINNATSSVNQCRKLTIKKPITEIFDGFKDAISTLNKCKIVKEENESILAKTGFSWKSFGEVITITDKSINNHEAIVEISSKPSLKTTMADYGKNLENIEELVSYFKAKYGEDLKENT